MKRKIAIVCSVLCGAGAVLLASVFFTYRFFLPEFVKLTQGSIGIIGGADGPTAVFVTGKIDLTALLIWALILAAAAAAGVILYRRMKKQG